MSKRKRSKTDLEAASELNRQFDRDVRLGYNEQPEIRTFQDMIEWMLNKPIKTKFETEDV